jgi:hypothetical protein
MGGLSDYVENWILAWFRGTTAPAAPSNLYVALFSDDPGDVVANELSGSGYARVAVAVPAGFTLSGDQISNASEVLFPNATADWVEPTWAGLCDASSAGHLLTSGLITTPKAVLNGDAARFSAGTLVFTLE